MQAEVMSYRSQQRKLLHTAAGLVLGLLLIASAHSNGPPDLTELQRQIHQLSNGAISAYDRQRLDGAVAQLELAKNELVRKTDQMSLREQTMAEVQLVIAIERLKVVITERGGRGGLAWSGSQRATEEATASANRTGAIRLVEVIVSPQQLGSKIAALEVYAVPLGVIPYVGTLSDSRLRNVLEKGRFANLTSPATDQLETGGDYAVWISEPHRLGDVMEMLRQRRLTTYRKVDAKTTGPIALYFDETEQVRLPSTPLSRAAK